MSISSSSIWRLIHDAGRTRKVLERRVMHIKEQDVFRFADKLAHVNWCHSNLIFLDDVSFDNREQTIAIRGDFQHKPRVSVLAVLGVTGIIDANNTQGTFDRVEFFRCRCDFAYSVRGNHQGRPNISPCILSFFNPIKFMFGYIKKHFQRYYVESSGNDLLPFIVETFNRFENFSMSKVYEHCGWKVQGHFDPNGPLSKESQHTDVVERDQQNLRRCWIRLATVPRTPTKGGGTPMIRDQLNFLTLCTRR
ncbi:hypothetical protein PHMEG_00035927 [Phytophthora megakarya]|uniref:Uncharacterized protein n=1 Tax=Phytophthora megakarya TaxID=4795 RepID=A0A225UP97_9STRA|nr:hypothetical protein PHMEG_00035927 [Phytophthora megakarya]